MPAPDWILTEAEDLIQTKQVKFIQRVRASLVINFKNGSTINYQYADESTAQAWKDAYDALMSPTVV